MRLRIAAYGSVTYHPRIQARSCPRNSCHTSNPFSVCPTAQKPCQRIMYNPSIQIESMHKHHCAVIRKTRPWCYYPSAPSQRHTPTSLPTFVPLTSGLRSAFSLLAPPRSQPTPSLPAIRLHRQPLTTYISIVEKCLQSKLNEFRPSRFGAVVT
jgi:hypothetical protein